MFNECDLCFSDDENKRIVLEAKKEYKYVRQIKHNAGYNQLFVSREDKVSTIEELIANSPSLSIQ